MDNNQQPEKNPSLKVALDKINFSNKNFNDISNIHQGKTSIKNMIGVLNKSSRGPSNAERITGLQTLHPDLGMQFVKKY